MILRTNENLLKQEVRPDYYHNMSSVVDAGPVVRTNQLDYDEEVIYKSTQYLYDHVRHRGDQPFCLTVSMTHPHDPYAITKEFWDMYKDVDIPLPKTAAIPHDEQDPHSQRVLKCVDLWGKELPDERIKAARRAYYGACSYVDSNIGKLLKALDDCGLTDDTIIVFTGDHGDMLGERGLWYKMVWYENSARVPFIVHAPKRFTPKRVKENVSTMDILPTFVGLIGSQLEPSLPMDGVSLLPYITGGEGVKTDTVFGEYMAEGTQTPVIMIRRGKWKFIYSMIDPPMLFDLEADPLERNNLAVGLPIRVQKTKETKNHGLSEILSPADTAAPGVVSFVSTEKSFFPRIPAQVVPTPPRTPSPTLSLVLPENDDPTNVFGHFMEEIHSRWNLHALHDDVVRSQRRRRLVYSALIKGVPTMWDFEPRIDPSTQYVRNQSKGALDDVEYISRWPRVPVAIAPR